MTTPLSDRSGDAPGPPGLAPDADGARIGEHLRRAREQLGRTLDEVSRETKISVRRLEAIERDDTEGATDGFYRRAEIRAYARAVKLDQEVTPAPPIARAPVPEKPPASPETARERPRMLARAPFRQRAALIAAIGVAGALFGRAIGGRQTLPGGDARDATDSTQTSVTPVPESRPDVIVGTTERTQGDDAWPNPPSAGSDAVPARSSEAPSPSSDDGVATEAIDEGADANALTELLVATQPAGARVTVNGIAWGIAPVTIRYLPAGEKRIRVSKEGYAAEERVVRLAEHRQTKLDIQLSVSPEPGP